MQPEFWLDRWRCGQTGFHQSAVEPNLREFWPALAVPTGSRVFVPLCGKTLDILWLREQGYVVVGVEIADGALQAFCMENGVPARRRSLPDFDLYQAENLELLRGDFFALTPALLGDVAAIYDRGALISWAPNLRARYAEQLAVLTGPGTKTLLVAVEYAQAEMHGPPFSLQPTEIHRLYAHNHQIRELSRHDKLAQEPRFRARGVSKFSEICYSLLQKQVVSQSTPSPLLSHPSHTP